MNCSKTAILFFSRTLVAEAEAKSWTQDRNKNLKLSNCLINSCFRSLLESNLPVYYFDESQQLGTSFGERLASGFEFVFNEGFDNVVSVGNDCPFLEQVNWQEVVDNLSRGHVVTGKTPFGVYLVGLNRKNFIKDKFAWLEWQTSSIFDSLKKYAEHTELYQLSELDEIQQYSHFFTLYSLFSKPWKRALQVILFQSTIRIFYALPSFITLFYRSALKNKASPTFYLLNYL